MIYTKFYIFAIFLIQSYSLEATPKCNECTPSNHCDKWIAKLVSVRGNVEKQNRNHSKWQPVSQFEYFCQGDKIRTLKDSRVKLKFIHDPTATVELEQNSGLTFPKIEKNLVLPFNLEKSGTLFFANAVKVGAASAAIAQLGNQATATEQSPKKR
jgi:hypothetical protein